MRIRPARAADIPTIAAYHVAAWQSAYTGLIPDETIEAMGIEFRLSSWTRTLGPENGLGSGACLVADVDGEAAGHVLVSGSELFELYMNPDHWGHGYGRALLQAGMGELAASGVATARLVTLNVPDQPAYQLYLSLGWVPGEIQQSDLCGGAEEVIMTVDLAGFDTNGLPLI